MACQLTRFAQCQCLNTSAPLSGSRARRQASRYILNALSRPPQPSRVLKERNLVTAATQLVAGVREMSAELWQRLEAVYEAAQEKGALYRIHTRPEPLRDAVLGLHFQLQISEALRDKPKAKPESANGTCEDVFATRDEDLSIEENLAPAHMLRLNKFNVVPFHSLVITRHFEAQTDSLTEADWEATLTAMQAYPAGALAYYNAGENSGSSQPRKHLQLLPLAIDGIATAPLPLAAVAQDVWTRSRRQYLAPMELRALPFESFAAALPQRASSAELQEAYNSLMAARTGSTRHAHYNVLLAEQWMLLVPRSQENCGPVGCNALVFAGTLLVRSKAELDFIQQNGPLKILQEVTFPWESRL